MLSQGDFDYLRSLVDNRPGLTVGDLLQYLTPLFRERVDGEVARASMKSMGVDVAEEEAKTIISELLAGWLIESGEYWRILKLRRTWEP